MARITIEQIREIIGQHGWTLISDTYTNLDTEMHFRCNEQHDIYAPWKKLRNNVCCPECKSKNAVVDNKTVQPKSKGAIRTLALDQASHITGYAIFDNDKLITSGTFQSYGAEEVDRIYEIKNWVSNMINNWHPDIIGIEGIQFQEESAGHRMGVTVFETLAHLQGVLMLLCYENKMKYIVCPTNTWRHGCGVKGKTRTDKKRSMQMLVKEWYGINVTDDIADAIGIGYYISHNKIQSAIIENWEI